jgi:putative membrane protein
MVVMAVIKPGEETIVYTALTPRVFALIAVGGMLAAIAMLVPGISGAFLLLLIGLYRTLLQAVSDLNILLLIPLILGAGIGLLVGAASIRFLLSKVPRETYGAVLGLVAGSVIVLYPGGFGNGVIIIISVISMLAGCVLSFIMGRQKE